ncbi:MAG: phosphate signaling complex protein PhoU [Methylobacteriaceae bacterium]|jgi:phosphate transport system protein|nr:phosphate signaling complex protein PhoU [Methylobacteriaceae bacterium]
MSHIVSSYDTELNTLSTMISEMGGVAETMLADAVEALVRRDADLAREVIARDKTLDKLQREVEERAVLTIARRQPMATDLRETIAAIRMAGDLERIGDRAKNNAKRAIAIRDYRDLQGMVLSVRHMGELALAQLRDVLDAHARRDIERAVDVWRRDGAIDSLDSTLLAELLAQMAADPRSVAFCTHMMFCSKNVERIGDHTTNIAETVYYRETGEALPDDRPKKDSTASVNAPKREGGE